MRFGVAVRAHIMQGLFASSTSAAATKFPANTACSVHSIISTSLMMSAAYTKTAAVVVLVPLGAALPIIDGA